MQRSHKMQCAILDTFGNDQNQQAPGWVLGLRDLEALKRLLLWRCALMKRLWGLKLCLQVGVWVEVERLCPAEGWGCYCSRLWGSQTGEILWGGGRLTPVTSLSSQHRICCPPSVWATRATPKLSPTPFRAGINASPADLNTNPVRKYLCNVTGLVRCASHVMLGEGRCRGDTNLEVYACPDPSS